MLVPFLLLWRHHDQGILENRHLIRGFLTVSEDIWLELHDRKHGGRKAWCWGLTSDTKHTSVHPRWRTQDRPKRGYHQSPIWWTNEFLLELFTGILNITFEELLRGTEMTQRQLYHQGPPQHAWQLTEPGGTWNTAHPQLNRLENVLSPVPQLV